MNIRDRQGLKQAAAAHLEHACYNPRKLAVIHGGLIVGVALVISLLSMALTLGMDNSGGLSGMGMRNILQTAESALQLAYTFLTPFWQVGILFAFLSIVRRQPAQPRSLLRGFARFGPVLRLMLAEALILFVLCFVAAYSSSFLCMMFSPELMELLTPIAEEMAKDPTFDPTQMLMQIPAQQLLSAALPMLICFGVLYLAAAVFFGFRTRFASYLVLDDPGVGAFAAIIRSFRMTHGSCGALLRLDLSFWLYYVLLALITALNYVQLLPADLGGAWLPLVLYMAYGVGILALDWFMRPMLEATYALAYDTLREEKFPTQL